MTKSIITFLIMSIIMLSNYAYCEVVFKTCGKGLSGFNVQSFTFDGVTYLANSRGGIVVHKPAVKDTDKKGSFYHGSPFCIIPNCLVNHNYRINKESTYDFSDVFKDKEYIESNEEEPCQKKK